ncbi:uncharacterized protein isoform X2 [Musca autumnalis]|uniref:uncharacterized protein isoform X2 n=1 Tax=Musca autumnalis TaxID=221902 RepID=UPI003CEF308E
MIFFLINRFRRKKLRARENRQTAEDQRSIVGSIGYIAGNMGYMEGNLSSMDYTYGGAAHYPLWKPPSGYFPRGEAPPPYDEAVAISQAEALSAQCAAAAAAAQVASNQRATMGMNSVELQTADINRRAQQMQQIQHHAQPQQPTHGQMNHQTGHVVPTLQAHVLTAGPQGQTSASVGSMTTQPQSHQITQSTTNLINININSGGNITTIATGENHQPPYSLQDEVNNAAAVTMQQTSQQMQLQQQQHHHHQQQQAQQQHHQAQQQQQQMIAATSTTCVGNNANNTNRLHIAQSNSICVQTMAPMVSSQHQQQQQQQHQMVAAPQQSSSASTTQSVLQSAQIMASTLTANASTTASLSRQQQQQHSVGTTVVQNLGGSNNDCGYKNCHLNGTTVSSGGGNTVSRRLQRTTDAPPTLQQYVVDVEVNVSQGSARGYHSLPPCSNGPNATEAGAEVIASPTQFGNASPSSLSAAISTPAIDVDTSQPTNDLSTFATPSSENHLIPMTNTGHNTLPLQHSQSSKSNNSNGGTKTSSSSSSSKRYHRTMPRYYAIADPLTQNLSTKSSKAEAKMAAANSSANSNNVSSSATSASSNASSSSTSSKKPTCQCPVQHVPMSYMGSTQLSNAQNATNNAFFTVLSNKLNSNSSASNSPSPSQHSSSSSRLQANNSNTNSLNYQQRSTKSSSQSSSQTDNSMLGNSANNTMKRSTTTNNTTISSTVGGHCNYEGKIATISSGELINSSGTTSSGGGSQQSQQQHHHHGHAHHHSHHSSSLMLPPQHHDDSSPIVLGRVTKRSSSSSGDRLRSASSGSTRASMVDSTTITSPAAAAYLNSKNVGGGKMSLNSTINSVVSKVPSVISLPPTGNEQNNNYHGYNSSVVGGGFLAADNAYNSHQYLNEMHGSQSSSSPSSATTSKSTTLPKILRSKQRDVHNSSLTPSNLNCNSSNTATSSNNYAVSQCSMPAYPKQQQQYASASNSANSSSTLSNGASSSSSVTANSQQQHQQQQQQPTNINNMQTQTITSTLAVNYCPEDSHLNATPQHSHNAATTSPSNSCNNTTTINGGRSTSPFSPSASSKSNQQTSAQQETKQLPVCTTSKNCLNPKEHFLPNDTSLDDDYLSECENCKIAQSSKYYLNAEALTNVGGGPQETMTLQRKSLEECKEEPDTGYYRISHTLPTNSKKNAPVKTNNRDQWFSTIPAASSSSEEDINE